MLQPTKNLGIVAKRLKEARLAAELSQKALGILAGLDPAVASPRMNQYERSTHVPDGSLLRQIAHALKVPAAYFYADDDDLAACIVGLHRLSKRKRHQIAGKLNKFSEK